MGTAGFHVRVDTSGGVACAYVTGDIDMATADHLCLSITNAVNAGRVSELMIDLAGVTFCDSTGVQALVNTQRDCLERGVAVILHQPSDRLRDVLKLTGLSDHFTIRP